MATLKSAHFCGNGATDNKHWSNLRARKQFKVEISPFKSLAVKLGLLNKETLSPFWKRHLSLEYSMAVRFLLRFVSF